MFSQVSKPLYYGIRIWPVEILSKRVYPEKSMIDTFAVSLSAVFHELTAKQA